MSWFIFALILGICIGVEWSDEIQAEIVKIRTALGW